MLIFCLRINRNVAINRLTKYYASDYRCRIMENKLFSKFVILRFILVSGICLTDWKKNSPRRKFFNWSLLICIALWKCTSKCITETYIKHWNGLSYRNYSVCPQYITDLFIYVANAYNLRTMIRRRMFTA